MKTLFKVSRISKILGRELNVLETFKVILTQNASLETTQEAVVQPGDIKATPNNLEAILCYLPAK